MWVNWVAVLWIAYDVGISIRTAHMQGAFSHQEWNAWFFGGLVLALLAFVAAFLDRRADRKQIAELNEKRLKHEGFIEGAFTRMDRRLEKMAIGRPDEVRPDELRQGLIDLKKELESVKTGMVSVMPGMAGTVWLGNSTTTITIQDPKGGEVPHRKIVTGFVQPTNSSVQLFVRAGPENERFWYRQGNVQVKFGEWIARCVIGSDNSPTGGEYRLCAVAGAKNLENRFKDFPSDVVKSEIVTVTLNRDLSDDWLPQGQVTEATKVTPSTDANAATREWAQKEYDRIMNDRLDAYHHPIATNHQERVRVVNDLLATILGTKK